MLHTGDLFFNGMYPFIGVHSGGSVTGMIAAADKLLVTVVKDDTRIIPGHGPLATKADYKAFRDMQAAVRDAIARMVKAGKTLEQVVAAKSTAAFDARWAAASSSPISSSASCTRTWCGHARNSRFARRAAGPARDRCRTSACGLNRE